MYSLQKQDGREDEFAAVLYLLESVQYLTIAANESGLRLAPPTSAPSISS
jgi:hypothetical protein